MDNFIKSKAFKIAIISISGLAAILLVFKAGVAVGYVKASFSYRWGEQYHRNFAGPRDGFMPGARVMLPFGPRGGDFMNAHGIFGTVLQINGNEIIINTEDGAEKTVVIGEKTVARSGKSDLPASEIKPDMKIVVIGAPDEGGRIAASLIRIFPN
jgi:hypothetical protein